MYEVLFFSSFVSFFFVIQSQLFSFPSSNSFISKFDLENETCYSCKEVKGVDLSYTWFQKLIVRA